MSPIELTPTLHVRDGSRCCDRSIHDLVDWFRCFSFDDTTALQLPQCRNPDQCAVTLAAWGGNGHALTYTRRTTAVLCTAVIICLTIGITVKHSLCTSSLHSNSTTQQLHTVLVIPYCTVLSCYDKYVAFGSSVAGFPRLRIYCR